jgi:hypothetical protein
MPRKMQDSKTNRLNGVFDESICTTHAITKKALLCIVFKKENLLCENCRIFFDLTSWHVKSRKLIELPVSDRKREHAKKSPMGKRLTNDSRTLLTWSGKRPWPIKRS